MCSGNINHIVDVSYACYAPEIVGGGIGFGGTTNVKMQPATNETAPAINLFVGRSPGDGLNVSLFSGALGPQRRIGSWYNEKTSFPDTLI